MSKLQSAIHNIGHHALSGMCGLLAEGYSYCKTEEIEVLSINLFNSEGRFSTELKHEVSQLTERATSILTATCGLKPNEVDKAVLSINYRFSDKAYLLHLACMESIDVWYGHDPLYDATIEYRLKNGTVSVIKFSNRLTQQYT